MFLLIFSFVSLTAPFASSPVAYSPFVNSPFATSPFKSLYMFKGAPDGQAPEAGLVELKGALYGTTYEGGTNNLGTVFEIDKRGQEHVLYSFQGGTDGAQPAVGLIALDGVLYGTTLFGGSGPSGGNGTVFSITTSGHETVLYRFQGGFSDGQLPYGSLVAFNGKLYGTTEYGGGPTGGGGIVFELSKSGVERVVYSFKDEPDGAYPLAGLIVVNGEFYGTTAGGGTLRGTVFEVSPAGNEHVLHTFKGDDDGETPAAPLVEFNGKLYGTTAYGGSSPSLSNGTVFEVSLDGKERIVHRFVDLHDGATPLAPLTVFNGALYGTTYNGGDASPSSHGNGTIFEVAKGGQETVLFDFLGGPGGGNPAAGLLLLNGRFYGTTSELALSQPTGNGTVFEFQP